MKKIYIQNLGMIVTEKCNLNCAHCLRGKCSDKVMSDEVIDATLSQVCAIGNLAICGGEPTLALDRLEKIFDYIIKNKILVNEITLVINGTIYSVELLRLLDYIDSYINVTPFTKKSKSLFAISWDKYHHSEIERLKLTKQYIENIEKYKESKHFMRLQPLTEKLFREGNAVNLDESLTVPLKPISPLMTYVGKFKKLDLENGLCNIGPLITINVDGIITECDASIENQRSLYNYGNVLTDNIEEIFIKRKTKILKPKEWLIETEKEIERYWSYEN